MLDLFNLPPRVTGDVQIFNLPSTATSVQWHSWIKPRGINMLHMIAISGGGGGGGGFSAAASSARGGGGSGGSSGISRLTIPAIFVPDRLYIQVGAGGQGVGSGGGTAGSGTLSYVCAAIPTATPGTIQAMNVFLVSGAAGPAGGGTGTGAAVGALGAAGTIATIGAMPLGHMGNFDLIAGTAGVAGGAVAGANGTAQSIPTATPFWGATGGAGTTSADFAGGAFTAQADSLLSEMRPATPAAGSNPGSSGLTCWAPFYSFGGGGGSASNAGVGGAGGNGGYGTGGGGGGGGTTGGRGGDGGSGLVIIIGW
jgi:hypothetical protein